MPADRLENVLQRIQNAADAAGRPRPALLAVSKTQPPEAVHALAGAGQLAFGENYVQEAGAKRQALIPTWPALQWHLIGHLQSNKAALAAEVFDWVQTVDRASLVAAKASVLQQEAALGGTTRSAAVFNEGDVIGPKIGNVQVLAEPSATAKVVATLARTDDLVVIGEIRDGYVNVQGATASGWVRVVLVEKR